MTERESDITRAVSQEEAFHAGVARGMFNGLAGRPRGIVLPFPVSTHQAFRKHNGSYLSDEYRKWRDEAGWVLLGQKPTKLSGPVKILIELVSPDQRLRDTDNYIKGPVDLLVTHGIIAEDNNRIVKEITARWKDRGEPCTVYVEQVA